MGRIIKMGDKIWQLIGCFDLKANTFGPKRMF